MRDYQEISEQIKKYSELKKELKGLSAEVLQNSEKYRQFLTIDYFLKNQIFTGEELSEIFNYAQEEYEKIKESYERTEKENSELRNSLEEKSKLENILKEIVGIIKGGTIIDQIKNVIRKYK